MKLPLAAWIAASLALATFVGCGGGSSSSNSVAPGSQYATSVQNVVALQTGLELYEGDDNGGMPLANWVDALTPYVHNPALFHSPAAPGAFGYAFNSSLVGSNYGQIFEPDRQLSFFDSTNLTRNAISTSATIPSPARYGTKNTLGYLDGETQDSQDGVPVPTLFAISQARVKKLAQSVLSYAVDYDDQLPLPQKWVDGLQPYTRNSQAFHSPAVENINPLNYGYALNSAFAGANLSTIANQYSSVIVFDSTDLQLNATDPTTTLPSPPRYAPFNTIGYLDGHVQLNAAELKLLSAGSKRR